MTKGKMKPKTTKKGFDILFDPASNKGTAFNEEERELYSLRGLLPPRVTNSNLQISRSMESIRGKGSDIERYIYLTSLQSRNEKLFYLILSRYFEELLPVIYTPTVGEACKKYAHIYRQPKGMYVSLEDRGKVREILNNWPDTDIRTIVVTDGERILGLGDLGANGMGIPIGKLQVYVACAGIWPHQCLPVLIDVGTNNQSLRDNPLYLGLERPRQKGPEYDELVEEFVEEVQRAYPNSLIQFEDFLTPNAYKLLDRYKHKALCFNDDIQGTAAVTLAGVLASTRISGRSFSDLKILFLGAGSAATGIADLISLALQREGLSETEARQRLKFVDKSGLLSEERNDLLQHNLPYISKGESLSFSDTLDSFRPHILIGATGAPGTFTKEIVQKFASFNERPTLFALSNPTSQAECTPEQAYEWTEGRAIFASGSPFKPYSYGGHDFYPAQGNNAYIFPAIGLATAVCPSTRITDEMFLIAANVLADFVQKEDLEKGSIYPPLSSIKKVTIEIAIKVIEYICEQKYNKQEKPQDIRKAIEDFQYSPVY